MHTRRYSEFMEQLDDVECKIIFSKIGKLAINLKSQWEQYFGNQIISASLWPPCSPDLTSPDFFLRSYLKDRVFHDRPQTWKTRVNDRMKCINLCLARIAVTFSTWCEVHMFYMIQGKSLANFAFICLWIVGTTLGPVL